MNSLKLYYEKETENKFRWVTDVDGVPFKLYVPQDVLPTPHPQKLNVWVEVDARRAAGIKANLKATVVFVAEQTQTVRYAPLGDPATWSIGAVHSAEPAPAAMAAAAVHRGKLGLGDESARWPAGKTVRMADLAAYSRTT